MLKKVFTILLCTLCFSTTHADNNFYGTFSAQGLDFLLPKTWQFRLMKPTDEGVVHFKFKPFDETKDEIMMLVSYFPFRTDSDDLANLIVAFDPIEYELTEIATALELPFENYTLVERSLIDLHGIPTVAVKCSCTKEIEEGKKPKKIKAKVYLLTGVEGHYIVSFHVPWKDYKLHKSVFDRILDSIGQ